MPVLAVGRYFIAYGSVFYKAELSASLTGLEISCENLPSTVINSPMRLNNNKTVFELPDSLVQGVYAIYSYNSETASWVKDKNFSIYGNKLKLPKKYNDVLLALPMDAMEDTFYADGEYVYEMYITRTDTRTYRNIVIGSASYRIPSCINLLFSLNKTGPWTESISSTQLFDTFYVKVIVFGIQSITAPYTLPSEVITLSCLTCE